MENSLFKNSKPIKNGHNNNHCLINNLNIIKFRTKLFKLKMLENQFYSKHQSNRTFFLEKMKVLEINRQAFILNAIFPTPVYESIGIKVRNKCFGVFSFVTVFVGLLGSINFVLKFVRTDLIGSIYALFQVSGYFAQVYTMSIALIRWRKFSSIFTIMQDFYDTCKCKRNSL